MPFIIQRPGSAGAYYINASLVKQINILSTLPDNRSRCNDGITELDEYWVLLMMDMRGGGTIIPGDYKYYQIQIDFDSGVEPGTVITNRVKINSQPSEDSYSRTTQVCEPITDVSFTFTPDFPFKGDTITFTATITPPGASTPVEYVWDFGDGDVVSVMQNVETHLFVNSSSYTVEGRSRTPAHQV